MKSPGLTRDENLAAQVGAGLVKLSIALRRHAWSEAGLQELTPSQRQALVVLARRGRKPLRLGELAAELALSPASASESVAALVRKKLVEKRRAPDDARAILLRPTRAGRAEARRASLWPESLAAAAGALPAADQATLLRLLGDLLRTLHERGDLPLPRMCAECRHFRRDAHPTRGRPHHCAFFDAPLGPTDLRLDCREFEAPPVIAH